MTKEQLKAARVARRLTQDKMAEALNVPASTYKKWEQGKRKVPGLVATTLAGKGVAVRHLSTDEALEFAKKTVGLDPDEVVAGLIREWLAKGVALALLFMVGHQVTHPEDGQPRRYVRRRPDAVCVYDGEAEG